MTIQSHVAVQSQVFIARDYDVFGGLDVDHHSIAVTFTDLILRNGIRSIDAAGSAEDLGTSFATPLVSRTLAQIYHCINPTPSPVMAGASDAPRTRSTERPTRA